MRPRSRNVRSENHASRENVSRQGRPADVFRRLIPFLVFVGCLLATFTSLNADEATAKAAIEKAGGKVRQIAADGPALEVTFHLAPQPITEEAVAAIKELPEVHWLDLRGTAVTDDMLAHLSGIGTLERIHLERTGITDAGISHLGGLAKLSYLNLYATKVTDAGVTNLAKLKSLKNLYLWQSGVTAEGLKQLKELLPETDVMAEANLLPPIRRSRGEGPLDKPLGTAQFVRVELPGEKKILSLAEVEVFEHPTGLPIQNEGNATQSSTDYGGDPGRANDGVLEPAFQDNSVTHTSEESNPWWELDLKGGRAIGRLRIINRKDCCSERLEGAVLRLLDAERKEVWTTTIVGTTPDKEFTFEAPKEEAPKVEAPKEETPKEEAPKEEAPKEEVPKEEAPKD
jgi:hypothetical protein